MNIDVLRKEIAEDEGCKYEKTKAVSTKFI